MSTVKERLMSCPRCDGEVRPEWSYCPQCGLVSDSGGDQVATLSNRIKYVRREPVRRGRRNAMVVSLANLSIGVSVLLVVGGAVMLFHPDLVPALFRPPERVELPSPSEPAPAEAAEPDADLEWVRVPAGPFQFGPTGRTYELELEEFEILKYEVTNGQWYYYLFEQWEYLRRHGRYLAAVPKNWGWEDPDWDEPPPFPTSEIWDKPVVFITWYQAQEFCTEWLAKQEGCSGARLPSRYEWEKAARGPKDDRPYPWGTEFFKRSERDRYRCNVSVPGVMVATEVTRFFKWDLSPYGAVGMAGNVSEFVGGATWQGFRGGSFSDHPDDAKLYIETALAPGSDHSWNYVGFRPARSRVMVEGE